MGNAVVGIVDASKLEALASVPGVCVHLVVLACMTKHGSKLHTHSLGSTCSHACK